MMDAWSLKFRGISLRGGRHTYKPSEDSLLLASNLPALVKGADLVLDIGTGSGVLAILASRNGGYVIAVDISIEALYDAYRNVCENGVEQNIDLILGDALEPIRSDIEGAIVISNPPYLPGFQDLEEDHIYLGGAQGVEVASKIAEWISDSHGKKGYIILSSYSNLQLFKEILENLGLKYEVIDEIVLDGETLYLYKIEKKRV